MLSITWCVIENISLPGKCAALIRALRVKASHCCLFNVRTAYMVPVYSKKQVIIGMCTDVAKIYDQHATWTSNSLCMNPVKKCIPWNMHQALLWLYNLSWLIPLICFFFTSLKFVSLTLGQLCPYYDVLVPVIFGPTNADDISITFGPVKIIVRDSDWLKSHIAASP